MFLLSFLKAALVALQQEVIVSGVSGTNTALQIHEKHEAPGLIPEGSNKQSFSFGSFRPDCETAALIRIVLATGCRRDAASYRNNWIYVVAVKEM